MLSRDTIEHYFIPLSPISTGIHPRGTIDKAPKCILFDIYGTLFISASGDISTLEFQPEKRNMITRLLDKYHIKIPVNHIIREYLTEISERHKALHHAGIDFPEVQIDEIWMKITGLSRHSARDFATEFELIINPVSPMPHLQDLIAACRNAGILLGIISNAQFYTEYLFCWFLDNTPERLGFHKDIIFYSYVSGHAKPSPHMFRIASHKLKEMSIPEKTVLYVGNDMLNDILTAKTVGFKTALFAGDARSLRLRENTPSCKDLIPDITVTDLIQLTKYF